MTDEPEIDITGLLRRLEAAERLCAAYTICGARLESEREKAAYELWNAWYSDYGHLVEYPSDLAVSFLAMTRDLKRAATLARLRGEGPGPQYGRTT